MLAFAMMAAIRHKANQMKKDSTALKKTKSRTSIKKKPQLIRWSIQEIRRIAQRQINPTRVIAWSLWRRAHQAAAKRAHQKSKSQL